MRSITVNLRRPFRRAHDGHDPQRRFAFRPKVRPPRPRVRGRRRHARPKR